MSESFFDLTKVPLGTPPEGTLSNLIDPPSQAWIVRLSIYTTVPAAALLVMVRLYIRAFMRKGLQLDDYFMVATAIITGCFCGTVLSSVIDDTWGRHFWDIPVSELRVAVFIKSSFITTLYALACAMLKITLCLLYLSIFSSSILSKRLVRFGIAGVLVSYTIIIAVWVAYSVPHANDGGWLGSKFSTRTATTTPTISLVLGCLGTATDLYILVIPIVSVVGLKMSVAKRVGLSALFLAGLLACAFSVAGIASRYENFKTVRNGLIDPFWVSMPAYGLCVAEVNIGIICACIPIVFPLFKGLAIKSSEAFSSLRDSFFTRTNTHNKTPPHSVDPEQPNISATTRGLPKPPKGTLTGLMSFVRGNKAPARRSDMEMSAYSEIASIDMDYHVMLANSGSGTEGNPNYNMKVSHAHQ